MPTRLREPGEFCWINILTADVENAKAFFKAVLGWTFGEIPGMGWSIRVGPSLIGGLFDLGGPQTPPGASAGIGVMVKVDDADAAAARAKELGGDARPAIDLGAPGRMAELFAPDGAEIDVWEPRGMPGTDVDPLQPGAPSWFEAVTRDVDRSAAFYRGLFGWTSESALTGASGYIEFRCRGEMVAGLLPTPEGLDLPPHWGVYITVKDVDAAAKLAGEIGGTVCLAPRDIPNVGRYASLRSPQGISFHVIHYSF